MAGANLTCAALTGANLIGANLAGTNLEAADLEGAYCADTNFADAIVTRANFRGAVGLTLEQRADLKQRGAIVDE